jgi:hypothetical protein
MNIQVVGTGIAQSVYRLSTCWTAMFDSQMGHGIFHLSAASRSTLGPTRPLSNGYRRLFPWGKAAGA